MCSDDESLRITGVPENLISDHGYAACMPTDSALGPNNILLTAGAASLAAQASAVQRARTGLRRDGADGLLERQHGPSSHCSMTGCALPGRLSSCEQAGAGLAWPRAGPAEPAPTPHGGTGPPANEGRRFLCPPSVFAPGGDVEPAAPPLAPLLPLSEARVDVRRIGRSCRVVASFSLRTRAFASASFAAGTVACRTGSAAGASAGAAAILTEEDVISIDRRRNESRRMSCSLCGSGVVPRTDERRSRNASACSASSRSASASFSSAVNLVVGRGSIDPCLSAGSELIDTRRLR